MTEADIRKSMRDAIDTYATSGALYMFMNDEMKDSGSELVRRTEWVDNEARRYGEEYYRKHRA